MAWRVRSAVTVGCVLAARPNELLQDVMQREEPCFVSSFQCFFFVCIIAKGARKHS